MAADDGTGKADRLRYDQDYTTIDLRQSIDVRYWAVMLNCTARDLRNAVSVAGPVVCDVDSYLRRRAAWGFKTSHEN